MSFFECLSQTEQMITIKKILQPMWYFKLFVLKYEQYTGLNEKVIHLKMMLEADATILSEVLISSQQWSHCLFSSHLSGSGWICLLYRKLLSDLSENSEQ